MDLLQEKMAREYGHEKCPLDEGKSCFDYDMKLID